MRDRMVLPVVTAGLLVLGAGVASAQVVLNEIDYDQPGTDAAEFIELRNNGAFAEDLDPYSIQLVNGSGGGAVVYDTIDLPAVSLPPGGYFVVCADPALTPNCDLDVSPDTNLIQNGAPDAVALLFASALVDAVSYEGDTGAPYTEGSGAGLVDDPGVDFAGISRFPDGVDTDQNNADLSLRCVTPGAANVAAASGCPDPRPSALVINEIDYDQPGTDAAEFVEITNLGPGTVDLDPYTLELVEGSGGEAVVYQAIDLPAVVLAAGGYFVVCGDAAMVAECDLDVSPDSDLIQNGAPDAVALRLGPDLVDSVSYEGDTGAPYTEGSGAGLVDDGAIDLAGISRFPDGADTDQNNVDLSPRCATPGLPNTEQATDCEPAVAPDVVINEIDYDQPGTDTAEFVELKNVGADPVDLSSLTLELVNGSNGAIYGSFALPAVVLAPDEYFVLCGDAANVVGCDLDVGPDSNLVQNGAPDAVGLRFGGQLIDAVSYEGDTAAPYTEGSGAGLEDDSGVDFLGISRFPDGADTDRNNVDLSPRCITPGAPNVAGDSGCTEPVRSALVINEIDYDQPGGDTAEFVELKNVGNTALDLSAYEVQLVNGSTGAPYATFALPAATLAPGRYWVLCAAPGTLFHCDQDVLPDTNLIQNGAPDAVALVSAGEVVDAVSYEGDVAAPYTEGSGTGLEDSAGLPFAGISRFPDGVDTDRNNVDLSPRCITPGAQNTSFDSGCSPVGPPAFEIFEIQGPGLASPLADLVVATLDNVVTAVGPEGFFVQTPEARGDGDPETSDGLYVFTGGPAPVAVGDRVDLIGEVQEFFGFTEMAGGVGLAVDASGEPLPAPVLFDETTPSPDQPQPATEVERYEGMLVLFDGVATGPTDFFGETPVVATADRAFREPGILFPGLPGLPVWDGNPEIFEIDPDGLGLADTTIVAGQAVAAEGPLAFSFGDYVVWPTAYGLGEAPPLPRPVRERAVDELTVASQNVLRLFDAVDDPEVDDPLPTPAEVALQLEKLSRQVREVLGAPDVLALQEVENLSVLEMLADRIALDDPTLAYSAWLLEGNDVGGIDVGFLTRDDTVSVASLTQLGKDTIFSFDGSLLNDRPPLVLEGAYTGGGDSYELTVIAVHQRSLSGIEGAQAERVRLKRFAQAEELALFVQDLQTADPDRRIVVTGDFNAFQQTDGYVDVVGIVTGVPDPLGSELPQPEHVDPPLANRVLDLPEAERYSFVFDGSSQVLDHALTSQSMAAQVRDLAYGRANADAPVAFETDPSTPDRSSDHDGLVLFLQADSDGDGVSDVDDLCPGTVIPEGVPTVSLGVNHHALVDGDGLFDTVSPPGGGGGASFTVHDTAGCSCEQIVEAAGLGPGHLKFGCSVEAMGEWVEGVE